MEHMNALKATLAAVCAGLTALWGWFGWLVVGWIGAMALDYITGSLAGLKDGEWSSSVARQGLLHKAGCIFAVLVSALLDMVIGEIVGNIPQLALPFNYTVFLCPLVLVWYILTEAGSIVENAGKLGAPVPPWLAKAIAALKDKVDDTAGTDQK